MFCRIPLWCLVICVFERCRLRHDLFHNVCRTHPAHASLRRKIVQERPECWHVHLREQRANAEQQNT